MKILSLIKLIFSVFLILPLSCTNEELPKSISLLNNNLVKFNLKDRNYKTVQFGSDYFVDWILIPMKKESDEWVLILENHRKPLQYKFYVNDNLWFVDPLNKMKKKVPPPYEGYNSFIDLSE